MIGIQSTVAIHINDLHTIISKQGQRDLNKKSKFYKSKGSKSAQFEILPIRELHILVFFPAQCGFFELLKICEITNIML